MPRVYPCEHCGEVIHEDQEYVLLAYKTPIDILVGNVG
jgi:hypothetical protein